MRNIEASSFPSLHTLTLIVLGVCTININPCQSATNLQDYALRKWLFEDARINSTHVYHKNARPAWDTTSSTWVYLKLSLLSLVDVNEQSQTLTTNVKTEMVWYDDLLAWAYSSDGAATAGGIESLLVRQEQIWEPDIIVANSVRQSGELGYKHLPIRLGNYGDIRWSPISVIETSCDIIVTYYPFDTQRCDIEFETAISLKTEVRLDLLEDSFSLDDYSPDGTWKLANHSVENVETSGTAATQKSKIRFSVILERRNTYYVLNIIVPVIFLTLTASLVFLLPADTGEKMGFSITVLLSFAVYLTVVAELLPTTSLQTSLLALYLILVLGYTALSVMVTAVVLRMHHKPETDVVPQWLKTSVREYQKVGILPSVIKRLPCKRNNPNTVDSTMKIQVVEFNVPPPTSHKTNQDTTGGHLTDGLGGGGGGGESGDEKDVTWQEVAAELDWFCFKLFTLANLLTTVIILLAIGIGAAANKPSLTYNSNGW